MRGASFPRAENDMMYDPALGISRVDSGAMHNPAFGIKKARSGVMQDLQFGILRANSGSMCDAGRGVPLPLQRAASYNVPVPSLPRSSSCRTTPPATHRVQHMAESLLSRALSPQLARPSPRSPLYSAWPSPADYHALHMQRPVDMQQNSPMLGRHSSLPARPYSSPITGEPNMHFPAMISNPNMDGRQGASPLGQDTMRASAVSSPMTGRRQVLAHHLQLDADPVVAARSSTLLAQPTARQTISPRADEISLLDGSPRPTVQQLPAGCADGALGMAMSPAPGVAPLGAALPELGFAGARRPEPHPHAHVAAVPASWQSAPVQLNRGAATMKVADGGCESCSVPFSGGSFSTSVLGVNGDFKCATAQLGVASSHMPSEPQAAAAAGTASAPRQSPLPFRSASFAPAALAGRAARTPPGSPMPSRSASFVPTLVLPPGGPSCPQPVQTPVHVPSRFLWEKELQLQRAQSSTAASTETLLQTAGSGPREPHHGCGLPATRTLEASCHTVANEGREHGCTLPVHMKCEASCQTVDEIVRRHADCLGIPDAAMAAEDKKYILAAFDSGVRAGSAARQNVAEKLAYVAAVDAGARAALALGRICGATSAAVAADAKGRVHTLLSGADPGDSADAKAAASAAMMLAAAAAAAAAAGEEPWLRQSRCDASLARIEELEKAIAMVGPHALESHTSVVATKGIKTNGFLPPKVQTMGLTLGGNEQLSPTTALRTSRFGIQENENTTQGVVAIKGGVAAGRGEDLTGMLTTSPEHMPLQSPRRHVESPDDGAGYGHASVGSQGCRAVGHCTDQPDFHCISCGNTGTDTFGSPCRCIHSRKSEAQGSMPSMGTEQKPLSAATAGHTMLGAAAAIGTARSGSESAGCAPSEMVGDCAVAATPTEAPSADLPEGCILCAVCGERHEPPAAGEEWPLQCRRCTARLRSRY